MVFRNFRFFANKTVILTQLSRKISTTKVDYAIRSKNAPDIIRNIGILAHIDAGKTTTTERILFYSGKIRSLGEVHHGNTVTDFLTQERERGITICSAAVTIPWHNDVRINLIDTPGHIDFTMEVEQSLGAVDGAVVILDGSAGVEAQTVTVWSQSDRYNLPKMVFVNKMDRLDADFAFCLEDLTKKLNADVVPLQWPIYDEKTRRFKGIIDILTLQEMYWDQESRGQHYAATPIDLEERKLEILEKKHAIIDKIAGHDDLLADKIINENGYDNLDLATIKSALKSATVKQKLVPVLMGSAYKNTGVQTLLDAVCDYFPSPFEINSGNFKSLGNDFVGRVFKVMHDKQRGPLSIIRVHNGELKKNMKMTVAREGKSEILQRIYEPLADEYVEVDSISAGNIAVCAGLKSTVTGDLVVGSASVLKSLEKLPNQNLTDELKIPDAVYFCSIEPPSLAQQSALDTALKQLQREDPSLRVRYDETTMQTVLEGMGELHLDIIKSRLLTEYKVDADLGPLQISYKETVSDTQEGSLEVNKEIAGAKQSVSITLVLVPKTDEKSDIFKVDNSPQNPFLENLQVIRPKQLQLIRKGAISGLERGPKIGGTVVDTRIVLKNLKIGKGTADSFLMAIANQCVQKILSDSDCRLMEPIMLLEIVTTTDYLSKILGDLGKRRGKILEITTRGEHTKIIKATAPLAELTRYSNTLRTVTSGNANLSIEPHSYEFMAQNDEGRAIRRAQGLE